jgi:hypothetical protein
MSEPSSVTKKGFLIGLTMVASLVGCHGNRLDPAARPIVTRTIHWDQVCRPVARPYPFNQVDELLDTAPLVGVLSTVDTHEGISPQGDTVAPFVDIAVNYRASGTPGYLAIYDSNLPMTEALTVAHAVREQLRPLGTLIEPLPVILHLEPGPSPVLDTRPSVRCLPHLAHDEAGRIDLPMDARITGLHRPGSPTQARARVTVGEDGSILEVLPDSTTAPTVLGRLSALLDSIDYEPGLINGEPVRASVMQIFIFPTAADSDPYRP